jgi:hypothetical protein
LIRQYRSRVAWPRVEKVRQVAAGTPWTPAYGVTSPENCTVMNAATKLSSTSSSRPVCSATSRRLVDHRSRLPSAA